MASIAGINNVSKFGESLIDDPDRATAQYTLGLVPGVDIQPYNAVLAALAALTPAADKFPYFTSGSAAALADISAFGRSLIDDAAAVNARSTLGLVIGTNVQAYDVALQALSALTPAADRLPYFTGPTTSALATFAAKGRDIASSVDTLDLVSKMGAVYGAYPPNTPGGAGIGLTNGDFNDIILPGMFVIGGTWANGPSGTTSYTAILTVAVRSTSSIHLQVLYLTNGEVWQRRATTSTNWLAWEQIGPILDGSNAGGDWVRYPNGIQECWKDITVTAPNTASGPVFISSSISWTFPQTFLAGTIPAASGKVKSGASQCWIGNHSTGDTNLAANFAVFRGASTASVPVIGVSAIGRWK